MRLLCRICAPALLLAGALCTASAADQPTPAPREAAAAGALPATLPLRRDASTAAEPANWGFSLLLLAVTGAAGGWMLWRRGARGRLLPVRAESAGVQRLTSQALTAQASVHAVQWHGEELLLGCTAQQVTLLGRRPVTPKEEAAP
jgi:flagellar biogenesis protein FliO